jgi:hypothetical protein
MKLERTALLTLAIFYGAPSMAIEPPREGQQAFLSRAVFVDGRLWLLTDAGELSSIVEKDNRRVDEVLPEPAHDICIHEGKLMAVTCKRDGCEQWSLRHRDHGVWSVDATFPVKNDRLLALACENKAVTVLTTDRLVDLDDSEHHEIHLSEALDSELVAAVHDTPEGVFVGLNAGEWGGGLRRIDRRTGKVTEIMSNPSGDLCGGPLNTQCDPVNGIVTEPWNQQCVAAAIGLVHMAPHGRIVEICGTTVRRIYFKEYPLEGFGAAKQSKGDEPSSTTAFFGLSTQGDSLWATGMDGIHEIGADGTARITPMPEFKEIGGVYVNFDLPHVVLVLTQVNQRRSLSGAVPLLVPREP